MILKPRWLASWDSGTGNAVFPTGGLPDAPGPLPDLAPPLAISDSVWPMAPCAEPSSSSRGAVGRQN